MIENFIDSAVIIDDQPTEVANLISLLEEKQILTKHYTPDYLLGNEVIIKNRKIIFLDLYINEAEPNPSGQIALIRKIFKKCIGKNFGTYGIVLWTKHMTVDGVLSNDYKEFIEKFKNNNDEYALPLFIVGLDKAKYIGQGHFNNLLSDLDSALTNNTAASFFIEWDSLVKKGKDNAITNIFSLVKNYEKQEQDLKYVLLKLAQNYTGIPSEKLAGYNLDHDAIKAFSDMLHYEITSSYSSPFTFLANPETIKFSGSDEEKKNIYSELNSKLLLDFSNTNQGTVIPGNIYEIIRPDDSLRIQEIVFNDGKKFNTVKLEEVFKNIKQVVLEVTPPCDFANKKNANRSRIITGILCDFNFKHPKQFFQGENYYTEMFPLKIVNDTEVKVLVFDFRFFGSINEADLLDANKYKIICRAKDKLFADILQKLSSHIARLGLSVVH